MTVRELIDKLNKHDPELDVEIESFPNDPDLPASQLWSITKILTDSAKRRKVCVLLQKEP